MTAFPVLLKRLIVSCWINAITTTEFGMSNFHQALITIMLAIYMLGVDSWHSKFQASWYSSMCHSLNPQASSQGIAYTDCPKFENMLILTSVHCLQIQLEVSLRKISNSGQQDIIAELHSYNTSYPAGTMRPYVVDVLIFNARTGFSS
jgi:hypothetical protein